MALQIVDSEWTIDANGVQQVMTGRRALVRAQSLAVPVFQRPPTSGPYVEDEAETRLATVGGGQWTLVLPWPSETRSGVSAWSITRMNGTVVQGSVPEGITGPLTVDDLLVTLSSLARADGGTDPYPTWTIAPGQTAAEPVAVQPAIRRPRGEWQDWVSYLPGDMVSYGALNWVALQASLDEQPPTTPVSSDEWGLDAAFSLAAMLSYVVVWDSPTDPGLIFYKDELLLYA